MLVVAYIYSVGEQDYSHSRTNDYNGERHGVIPRNKREYDAQRRAAPHSEKRNFDCGNHAGFVGYEAERNHSDNREQHDAKNSAAVRRNADSQRRYDGGQKSE